MSSLDDFLEERLRRRNGDGASAATAVLRNTVALAALARREREIPYWPRQRLEELQRERIAAIVEHAYRTVPFYRDFMRERGIRPEEIATADDLTRLPLIDANDLMDDPMRFVSLPFRTSGREVFKTSGSTSGLRKPIFWDHGSLLLRPARAERDRVVIAELAGEPWRQVIAREFITNERRHTLARLLRIADTAGHQRLLILPADFSNRTLRAVNSERTAIPPRPIHYHHLPPTVPLEVTAAHLRALRPRVVFSFGSYAEQFFRFVEATRTECPLPRVWVYLGDTLSDEGRATGERLGTVAVSTYAAIETGPIGFQCEFCRGFHLNVDLCMVRVVDEAGTVVPPGRVGDVVVSALDNRAMVLLNYRIGDRAALGAEECGCGRTLPLLAQLDGRRSELITLGDGREISSLTCEALFAPELRRTLQAQLVQLAPGHLRWRLVPAPDVDRAELADAVRARARRVLGGSTQLEIEFVAQIARTSVGKFVRTLRAERASS